MQFFQTLESQFPDADLTIRIKSKGGIQSISLLPVSTEENDIQPLIVSGTPQELDEQFFELIKKPLETTIAAIVNLEEQEKSVKASSEKPEKTILKAQPKKDKKKKEAPKAKEVDPAPVEGSLFEEPETKTEDVATPSTEDDADTIQDDEQTTEA